MKVDSAGQLYIANPGGGTTSIGTAVAIQVVGTDGTATNVGFGGANVSVPVTGAFSISSATVFQATASNLNATVVGTVTSIPSGTQAVSQTGSPWGVSGTVTSNQGGAPWTIRVQDGAAGTLATVTSANALKVDPSGVTSPVSGTITSVPSGTTTVSVAAGTVAVTQVTSPWVVGGTTTAVPSGTQNVSIVSGTAAVTGTVTITPSGTQAVSQTGAPWSVSITTQATSGASTYRNINLGTVGTAVKTAAGNLYGYYLGNNGTSSLFIKIYNVTTAPTSTDTPALTLYVPTSAAANINFPIPVNFATGIGVRATGAVADNDNTAPASNQAVINLFYA